MSRVLLPLLVLVPGLGLLPACTITLSEVPCDTGADTDDIDDTGPIDTGPGDEVRTDWVAVSVGGLHSCGLTLEGAIECWGADGEGQTSVPSGGPFLSVQAGYEHTCAIDADGLTVCWGRGTESPPSVVVDAVSAGGDHSCALFEGDASIACWGRDDEGQATAPPGAFAGLDAGWLHSCGVDQAGVVQCWGRDGEGQATPPGDLPAGMTMVTAGRAHSCGLDSTGAAHCWGDAGSGAIALLSTTFVDLSAGMGLTCGLDTGGQITCLSTEDSVVTDVPDEAGPFSAMSTGPGSQHACALTEPGGDGGAAMVCWGNGEAGQIDVPQ